VCVVDRARTHVRTQLSDTIDNDDDDGRTIKGGTHTSRTTFTAHVLWQCAQERRRSVAPLSRSRSLGLYFKQEKEEEEEDNAAEAASQVVHSL
jgi:hypothetical protein